MKRLLSILVILLSLGQVRAEIVNPVELVAQAALLYDEGNYEAATEKYEMLVSAFNGAPDLYYALGNSYYKQQNFAKAIVNYERCLQRDPANADARTNLELAQLNCVDKIETIQPVIFVTWSRALRDFFSADGWAKIAIVNFILFLIGCSCYFFVRKITIRKIGFYGSMVVAVLCGIALIYANQQAEIATAHDHAIVMAPTVTLRSTPAESGTQLLIIHEGLKVRVRQGLAGWSEVELSDGNVGWMKDEELEII